MARRERRSSIPSGTHHSLPRERGKSNGFTVRQSFRGLEQVAVQIQGLAEGLEGGLFGDWTQLHATPEADALFEVIEDNLPVVAARLRRAIKERRQHAASQRDAV
jgi:hypothetical protein